MDEGTVVNSRDVGCHGSSKLLEDKSSSLKEGMVRERVAGKTV